MKWPFRLPVRIRKVFRVSGLVFAGWFLVHTVVILADGLKDEEAHARWAVVFGNKVNPDRSLSPRLKARLDKTLVLYRKGQVDSIFVSGGVGVEGHPEGDVMRDYLVAKGVPEGKVRVDNSGDDTQASAMNFRHFRPDNMCTIIAVTQYYHVSRAKLALRRAGYEKVYGVHADFAWEWRDIWSITREFVGYYAYIFRDFDN